MFAPIRLFLNRSWPDESPLTSKLRKQREWGQKGRKDGTRERNYWWYWNWVCDGSFSFIHVEWGGKHVESEDGIKHLLLICPKCKGGNLGENSLSSSAACLCIASHLQSRYSTNDRQVSINSYSSKRFFASLNSLHWPSVSPFYPEFCPHQKKKKNLLGISK